MRQEKLTRNDYAVEGLSQFVPINSLEAVDFRAATAPALPLPPKHSQSLQHAKPWFLSRFDDNVIHFLILFSPDKMHIHRNRS